jgi:hypothetical protein
LDSESQEKSTKRHRIKRQNLDQKTKIKGKNLKDRESARCLLTVFSAPLWPGERRWVLTLGLFSQDHGQAFFMAVAIFWIPPAATVQASASSTPAEEDGPKRYLKLGPWLMQRDFTSDQRVYVCK